MSPRFDYGETPPAGPLSRSRASVARALGKLPGLREHAGPLADHALWTISRVRYERMMFRRWLGYSPNLRDPRTFNEKIAWRKLYQKIPAAPGLADKIAVRDYVRQRVGERYLKELIAVYESATEVDFGPLPRAFVAKPNNASGRNIFVPEKESTDLDQLRTRFGRLLAVTDYGKYENEWWYAKIPPRILVEPYLVDARFGALIDYEFYVYSGSTEIIVLTFDRYGDMRRSCYDRDWQPVEITRLPPGPPIAAPKHLAEMLEVAEELSRDIDFARIDLLCPNDEAVLFGEITLAPLAGWSPFTAPNTDEYLGSFWRLLPALDIGWVPG